MKDVESKIEDRRAMELMKIDVDNAISDIESRCRCIEEFCTKIKHNPFDEVPLMRPSVTSLSRYKNASDILFFYGHDLTIIKMSKSFLPKVKHIAVKHLTELSRNNTLE